MSKFISRLGTKRETLLINMQVDELYIPTEEKITKIVILWKRGDKTSFLELKQDLDQNNQKLRSDKIFNKASNFYSGWKGGYQQKLIQMKVVGVRESAQRKLH